MFNQIITNTYTVSDLRRRIQLLKKYLTAKFFAKGEDLPEELEEADRAWFLSFPSHGITEDNLSKTIALLEQREKEIKPLIVFLAITPAQTEIEALGKRIRADFGQNLLIELRLDPMLIAGAAIASKGMYKDYSLRQRLKDNHDVLVASFKKYMR